MLLICRLNFIWLKNGLRSFKIYYASECVANFIYVWDLQWLERYAECSALFLSLSIGFACEGKSSRSLPYLNFSISAFLLYCSALVVHQQFQNAIRRKQMIRRQNGIADRDVVHINNVYRSPAAEHDIISPWLNIQCSFVAHSGNGSGTAITLDEKSRTQIE